MQKDYKYLDAEIILKDYTHKIFEYVYQKNIN